jgi:formylglycine-generating enzyme required for sulfatase activity
VIDVTEDERPGFFVNSLGMKMIRIPEGSFVMGSSESDIAWAMGSLAQAQPVSLENEFPFHKVRISRPFFLSSTEVTVGQFQSFVQETGYLTDAEDSGGGMVFDMEERTFEQESGSSWRNPGWEVEENEPVTMISYNDAQAFVDWLAVREKLPYKLPTEAQWEYAARGGIPMAHFPWGDNMPNGELANYADVNTDFPWRDEYADDGYEYVAPVGSYKPNAFGLYDIAGNVLEWVRDYYGEDYYRFTPEIDPQGPGHGEYRVTKGGEWTFGPVNLRCAFRGWSRPEIAFYNTGFRVAIDLSETLRPFHFANDFLTREWVPGQDQREVAQAVARESARRPPSARDPEAGTGRPSAGGITHPSIKGVRVLDLGRRSDGQRAGLEQGDVIIEYDGVRNLTSEKFLALTAKTRRERRNPIVVFVRDGYQHTTRAARGYLGITVMNTTIRGPFKNPESRPARRDQDQRKKHRKPLEWT